MGHPEKLDEQGFRNMGKRIWGCDSCQRACPHNSAVSTANYPEELLAALNLENLLRNPDMGAIESWIGSYYARKEALQRQAVYAAANMRRKDLLEYIFPLTESENQPLREAALWAARQMA
jgi:epoxyqueuosine reductase